MIEPEARRLNPEADLHPPGNRARLFKLLVSLALYVFIFTYWVDVADLSDRLRATHIRYVLLGVLLYAAGQMISAYKWYLLLSPLGLVTTYARTAAFYFIGMFFNIFLPTIVGGDAVKAILLSHETGSTSRATISVFMERNVGLFALLTIAAIAVWYTPPVRLFGLPLPALVLLLLAIYVAGNLALATPRAYAAVDALVALTPLGAVSHRAASLYEQVVPYRHHGWLLAATILMSFLFQIIVIAVVFLNALALDQSFPLSAVAVFVPLISLAGMVPLTINGLGVREALYVLLFGQVGASRDLAVSLALLYLAVTFMASLPGGVVYALLGAKKELR